MPDTLLYNFQQSYDQLQLGGEVGGQAIAAAKSMAEAFQASRDEGVLSASAAALGSAGTTLLEGGRQIAGQGLGKLAGSGQTATALLAGEGRVVNPMLEMVYKSPNFRSFQFDFNFYPRDEREALEVQKILQMFMFHQAPEFLKGSRGFLVPPSQFDIKFYFAGKQNPNIPPIAPSCVLTTIDINYAPQGASFYEVPGETSPTLGGTGMPFAVNLVLQFQETTYLTKSDLSQEDIKQKTQSDGSITTETPSGTSSYYEHKNR